MTILKLTIESQGVSVNTAYGTDWKHRRRFMKANGQDLKAAATYAVYRNYAAVKEFMRDCTTRTPLRLTISVYRPIYNSRGDFLKLDGSNYIKLVEDAVSEAIGYDDRQHVTTTVHKVHSKPRYVTVTIEKL